MNIPLNHYNNTRFKEEPWKNAELMDKSVARNWVFVVTQIIFPQSLLNVIYF